MKKVMEDNMSKLWWPHSEALYSAMLFSDSEEALAWYWRVKEYTFSTFPNRENDRGEWIQIRRPRRQAGGPGRCAAGQGSVPYPAEPDPDP